MIMIVTIKMIKTIIIMEIIITIIIRVDLKFQVATGAGHSAPW